MSGGETSPAAPSLAGIFERVTAHAGDRPDFTAFRFLNRQGDVVGSLDWRQIEHQARRIGMHLTEAGLADSRVGILCPDPQDFVLALVGCFAAGIVAVPLPAVTNRRSAQRIKAIVETASLGAVLGSSATLLHSWVAELLTSADLRGLDLGRFVADARPVSFNRPVRGSAPALIQFTSGATATPRGILLTHDNICANCEAIVEAYGLGPNSEGLSWLPLHHDMGLVGHVLAPLIVGGTSSLMNPLHFLQSPLQWLRAVGRYKATITSAPNFAYDLCVREAERTEPEGIDLSSLTAIVSGGEPVWPDTIDRFCATFERFGLKRGALAPSYGLAEATLLVSSGRRPDGPRIFSGWPREAEEKDDASPRRAIVSLGRPVHGVSIRVVDETGTDCPEYTVGEVEVSGLGVGRPHGAGDLGFAGGVVRTGDLGFLADGELYVTGRRKEMIILQGQNVYPSDIEAAALTADPAIQPGGIAAVGVRRGGTEVLVVVFELASAAAIGDVALLVRRVNEAVVRATGHTPKATVPVRVGALPRTSSGKIQRGRLAELMTERLAGAASPDHALPAELAL